MEDEDAFTVPALLVTDAVVQGLKSGAVSDTSQEVATHSSSLRASIARTSVLLLAAQSKCAPCPSLLLLPVLLLCYCVSSRNTTTYATNTHARLLCRLAIALLLLPTTTADRAV